MSSTYQIITNESALREFIDWLPDCSESEQFYCCLFMRKKYCPQIPWIKSDKGQLRRFTATKDRLFDKVAQLECKIGAYKFDGNPVPQESLALYITPNPRDLWKATIRSIGHFANIIECQGKNSNPHQEAMSQIQKAVGTRKYILFDVDNKDETILNTCIETVNGLCDVIETRGGYHIHVHKEKVDQIRDKMWYRKLQAVSDVCGDNMTPLVGTLQGMHEVKFNYRYNDTTALP